MLGLKNHNCAGARMFRKFIVDRPRFCWQTKHILMIHYSRVSLQQAWHGDLRLFIVELGQTSLAELRAKASGRVHQRFHWLMQAAGNGDLPVARIAEA